MGCAASEGKICKSSGEFQTIMDYSLHTRDYTGVALLFFHYPFQPVAVKSLYFEINLMTVTYHHLTGPQGERHERKQL